MSDSEDSPVPSDVEEVAKGVIANLLPSKSKELYESAYEKFENWCHSKKIKTVSETVLLAYFDHKTKVFKPSTMWSHYSMLRTTISIHRNVDISKFTRLIAFLKKNGEGYRPKKSKIFVKEDFCRFLKEANDQTYFGFKVILIVAIAGGCRKDELVHMRVEDVQDCNSFIKINIPDTKTKVSRTFTISEGDMKEINLIEIVRKYIRMRPKHVPNNRFFLGYRNGKCTIQPVGINTFADVPKRIATFLDLPNPGLYTSHCFRRSSATLLANSGADLLTLKRHGAWKSNVVAESYVEESIENQKQIAARILGANTSTNIGMDTSVRRFETPSCTDIVMDSCLPQLIDNNGDGALNKQKMTGIYNNKFENCTINIYNK